VMGFSFPSRVSKVSHGSPCQHTIRFFADFIASRLPLASHMEDMGHGLQIRGYNAVDEETAALIQYFIHFIAGAEDRRLSTIWQSAFTAYMGHGLRIRPWLLVGYSMALVGEGGQAHASQVCLSQDTSERELQTQSLCNPFSGCNFAIRQMAALLTISAGCRSVSSSTHCAGQWGYASG
jgi:hypothetical protein